MAGYATLGRVQGGRVRAVAWRGQDPAELVAGAWAPVEIAGLHPELDRPLREIVARAGQTSASSGR